MFRFLRLALFICLTFVFTVGLALVLWVPIQGAGGQSVAYVFTPVPTATQVGAVEASAGEEFGIDKFSIEMAITEQPVFSVEIVTVEASPTPVSTPSPSPQSPIISREAELPADSKRLEFVERSDLVRNVRTNRSAIANLTYTINVASGLGSLSCADTIRFYEDVQGLEGFNVPSELQRAYDYSVRASNVVIVGVNSLYRFCQQIQLEQASQELESTPQEIVMVDEIEPFGIWEQAIAESNTGLRLITDAKGWLSGSPRLLNELYLQLDEALVIYEAALQEPTEEGCNTIRAAFATLTMDSTQLDLGENSEFRSSYSKYQKAILTLSDSGQALYDFCDSAIHGAGQLEESNLQMLPLPAINSALGGVEEAQALMELAHFYIEP